MAQNITLLGASYTDVPSVVLPKTGGGSAEFYDLSEDTVTSASHIMSGYIGHLADGTQVTGTASGGGGMTLDWADVQEITIGSNSVNNMSNAQTYLSSFTFTFLILKDALTVNNQLVFAGSNNLGASINAAYRYRNNTIGSAGISASYDCKLVEGSVYYAITKKTS